MGEPALKLVDPNDLTHSNFPYLSLLTKALVDSVCASVHSEVSFGTLERVIESKSVPLWIEALVKGDLEGRIAIGCEESTLRAMNSSEDPKSVLVSLHETLVANFEKQFCEEAFRCDFKKGSGFQKNYQLNPVGEPLFGCPVETPHGIIFVYLALNPNSKDLKQEIEDRNLVDVSRKIRVSSNQMDQFLDHVKSIENLEKRLLQGPEVRAQLRSQIKRMKRMLQNLRTEPLDTIFQPAQKLVNELAKTQGKQVHLEMVGAWLYLHKSLINFIYEPILHLIRNAVDHGIEEPLKREQNGKKAKGTIRILTAFNMGTIRIVFSDDGQGLDFGTVREKAVAKGIFSAEEANVKSKEELSDLIFQPGFSTRNHHGLVSGRGLGLDIVKRSIETLGGTLRLVSTSSHGTSFELLIPINEDFGLLPIQQPNPIQKKEDEEKIQLLDELSDYLERFGRALQALEIEQTVQSAYEAYRISHLMKGICGFLGWQRVVSFLYPFEEVLKLTSEEKIPINEITLQVLKEGALQLKNFCSASRSHGSFSLNKIRRAESRFLQLIWGAGKNDEKTHLFLGKHQLNAIENFFLPLAQNGSFSVRPEADFGQAMTLPFGALVQVNGDRRGFAGIYLPEVTLNEVIVPFVSGAKDVQSGRKSLAALTEFGTLMGNQFAEICNRVGIHIQPSAPLTYYGLGEPMRILGAPTYCFQCEINGYPFFLAGDFRLPQELSESVQLRENQLAPSSTLRAIAKTIQESLSQFEIKALISEESTQSDLVGFDGGLSSVITLVSEDKVNPDMVLFLSYEPSVSEHLVGQVNSMRQKLQLGPLSFFDSLGTFSDGLSGKIKTELENSRIKVNLSAPTLFVGKAYVANFNRLFLTNKLVGTSEKGRIEAQVLFTEFLDEKAA